MVIRGIIFGSQAKERRGLGDIDLLVVSPRFDDMSGRDDINLLWRIAARTDSRIEPIPAGKNNGLKTTQVQ